MNLLTFIIVLVVIMVLARQQEPQQTAAAPATDADAMLPGLVAALVELQQQCPQAASGTARNLLLTGKCSPMAVAALAPFAAVVYEDGDSDEDDEDEQPPN